MTVSFSGATTRGPTGNRDGGATHGSVIRSTAGARPGRYCRGVPRGDGQLTHDLDPSESRTSGRLWRLQCLGAGGGGRELTYFGLYALQHRGQEAAGIAVPTAAPSSSTRTSGWSARSSTNRPSAACAVTRRRPTTYSTTGALDVAMNAQPHLPHHRRRGRPLALCPATAWSTPPSWPVGPPTTVWPARSSPPTTPISSPR